jgi:hypothetical protein
LPVNFDGNMGEEQVSFCRCTPPLHTAARRPWHCTFLLSFASTKQKLMETHAQ